MANNLDHEHFEDTPCEECEIVVPNTEDDGAEYATYPDTVPASLNEDDELPPYSIYARYWPTADKDPKPLKYARLVCGHKLRGEFEPNHRNCERCWFTYFQTHGELTQAVEQGYQAGGGDLIKRLKGPKFLDAFLKFMSTVALIKRQQEEALKAKNEQPEATV